MLTYDSYIAIDQLKINVSKHLAIVLMYVL